jgi:dTDP-4-dehydrorhamnose 3,5-epimerase
MKVTPKKISGMVTIEPTIFRDERGFFLEAFQAKRYEQCGVNLNFVQINHSKSIQNTIRGLHSQFKFPQGKLVRVLKGEIFDVGVDARRTSPTYGQWDFEILSSETFKQLYIPPGCFHGFAVLSPEAEVEYLTSDFYVPDDEIGIIWNDTKLSINWPVQAPILSKKDKNFYSWEIIRDKLSF